MSSLANTQQKVAQDFGGPVLPRTLHDHKSNPITFANASFAQAAARYVDEVCREASSSPTVQAMLDIQPSLKKTEFLTASLPSQKREINGESFEVIPLALYMIPFKIQLNIAVDVAKSESAPGLQLRDCIKARMDPEAEQTFFNEILYFVRKAQSIMVGHEMRHAFQDARGLLLEADDLSIAVLEADAMACEHTVAAEKYIETDDPFYVKQSIRENPITGMAFFERMRERPHTVFTGEAANAAFESFFKQRNLPKSRLLRSSELPFATRASVSDMLQVLKDMPYKNKNGNLVGRRHYLSGMALGYDDMVAAIR